MEIERKWMVHDWPEKEAGTRLSESDPGNGPLLPLLMEQSMRQGYLVVRPTVRIREEATLGGQTHYVLCLKTGSGIVRNEIEMDISQEKFHDIEQMIGLPLIPKFRRTYALPDGLKLEVNHVDIGEPTEFWYAEVEYPTEGAARNWNPASVGLAAYLNDDVSDQPGQSMGEYWEQTRLGKKA